MFFWFFVFSAPATDAVFVARGMRRALIYMYIYVAGRGSLMHSDPHNEKAMETQDAIVLRMLNVGFKNILRWLFSAQHFKSQVKFFASFRGFCGRVSNFVPIELCDLSDFSLLVLSSASTQVSPCQDIFGKV